MSASFSSLYVCIHVYIFVDLVQHVMLALAGEICHHMAL